MLEQYFKTLYTEEISIDESDRTTTYTCFAWAGGTFFLVVLLCQFFVLVGNRFWLYILLCTQSTIQLWCCVSFFGSGGKQFLVLRTYLVYNTVVWLCHFFYCGRKVNFVRIFLLNPNFLLEHRKFFSRTYAIIPQKYQELSMQVETWEQSQYSFNACWKKNYLYF